MSNYTLCLRNISKDFTINNMEKTGLKGSAECFSIDFNPIDTSNISDTHKYLMKEKQYKVMFGFIKKNLNGIIN